MSSKFDIILHQNLNPFRILLYQCECKFFRVKKPSCKILKTKNCVPFEVQYTSSSLFMHMAKTCLTGQITSIPDIEVQIYVGVVDGHIDHCVRVSHTLTHHYRCLQTLSL